MVEYIGKFGFNIFSDLKSKKFKGKKLNLPTSLIFAPKQGVLTFL